MTYDAMKQKFIDELAELEVGTPEYANAAKALSELMKAEAEIKQAEADEKRVEAEIKKTEMESKRADAEFKKVEVEEKRVDAEAWKCESNETVAKTEAKASIVRSVIDGGVKVVCACTAAYITKYGYELITEHENEKFGCCVSAVKGFIPKLKIF